jgi:demethylmenaquinone methyltransferase/2-methoxy-6-polyprenyl-1,4-benzoquinol methylase
VYGLGARDDATVFTVDTNEELLATVATAGWPPYVEFVHDDGLHAVREFAPFDLVFADAAGGKFDGLDVTIAALNPGGVLLVDDMDLARHADDGLSEPLGAVREQILGDSSLVAAELDFASGVILATKRAR